MTREQKELLLKDLCARLPYGIKAEIRNEEDERKQVVVSYGNICYIPELGNSWWKECKPYLFPLSSMTEEQFEELKAFAGLTYEGNTLELVEWDSTCDKTLEFWLEEIPSYCVIKVFDWLNKNHFDYRGLIPAGSAIDATGKNIY